MGSEDRPWDVDYCEDSHGDQLTPFRYFASPWKAPSKGDSTSFPYLLDLPPEIRLLIFGFCDASTLFQLMRTCKAIRSATSTLFWSHPTVWYVIHSNWWEARRHSHPGAAQLNVEFVSRVTQIVIQMGGPLEFKIADADWYSLDLFEKSAIFWRAVKDSFPSARSIVLSIYPMLSRARFTPGVTFLMQQAPPEVQVFLKLEEAVYGVEQLTHCGLDRPRICDLGHLPMVWRQKQVRPPFRQLPEGPLRDYERMWRLKSLIGLEEGGYKSMVEQTHISFPYIEGIRCPNLRCNALLEDVSFWQAHITLDQLCFATTKEKYSANTPQQVVDALAVKKARISDLRRSHVQAWVNMHMDMGDPDSDTRKAYMDTFKGQIRQILYPNNFPSSTLLRLEYFSFFTSFLDPTHEDYNPVSRNVDEPQGPPSPTPGDSDSEKDSPQREALPRDDPDDSENRSVQDLLRDWDRQHTHDFLRSWNRHRLRELLNRNFLDHMAID